MKTKLSAEKKASRQEWRDKQHQAPVTPKPHHQTKQERRDLANTKPQVVTMTAAEYFTKLFSFVDSLAKPKPAAKVKYLKARARKATTKHAEEHANLQNS